MGNNSFVHFIVGFTEAESPSELPLDIKDPKFPQNRANDATNFKQGESVSLILGGFLLKSPT